MHAARRPAIPNLCSTCRRTSRPPSEDISSPSKRASISRPRIGDRPGKMAVVWSLAGMMRPDRCGLDSTPKSYIRSAACTRARVPANPHAFLRLDILQQSPATEILVPDYLLDAPLAENPHGAAGRLRDQHVTLGI